MVEMDEDLVQDLWRDRVVDILFFAVAAVAAGRDGHLVKATGTGSKYCWKLIKAERILSVRVVYMGGCRERNLKRG